MNNVMNYQIVYYAVTAFELGVTYLPNAMANRSRTKPVGTPVSIDASSDAFGAPKRKF